PTKRQRQSSPNRSKSGPENDSYLLWRTASKKTIIEHVREALKKEVARGLPSMMTEFVRILPNSIRRQRISGAAFWSYQKH
ncbi:MAG: hypothetical protein ABIO35_01015, partial [Nitrobacter sp.]